jgi:hypothetical protein
LSAIITWSFWNLNSSDRVLEKTFRYTEIACFIIPISTFLSSVLLASAFSQHSDNISSGWGMAASLIGGIVASFIALLFSALFGVVFHIVANNFQKKAEQETSNSFSSRYGLLFVLSFIAMCDFFGFFAGLYKLSNTVKKPIKNTPISSSTTSEQSPAIEQPLVLKGATIKYVEMDYSFQNHFRLTTKVQNKSNKSIKGFEGAIIIKDMFDNQVGSYNLSEVGTISKNQIKTFVGTYDYNRFDSDDAKIINSKGQLHYSLELI